MKALERARKTGDDHAIDQAMVDLANHYRDKEDWPNLRKWADERHRRFRAAGIPNPVLIYLAGNLSGAGMHDEALVILDRVVADYESMGASVGADFYTTRIDIHVALGNPAMAVDDCREALDFFEDHREYSDFSETLAQLADILQYHLQDLQGSVAERERLWCHFRSMLDSDGLSQGAARIHIRSGVSYAHALTQVDPTRAPAIYAQLIEDLQGSPWFGPDCLEIPHLQAALEACDAQER